MGSVDVDSKQYDNKDFTDEGVCKYFLTGLCPHELFENTKFYLGECRKIHSEELRKSYMEAREARRYYYEEDLARVLQQQVDDCDRKIARGQQRCDADEEQNKEDEGTVDAEEEIDQIKKLDEDISAKIKEVEEKAEEGDIDGSMVINDKIKELKRRKEQLQSLVSAKQGNNLFPNQKLKPCNICGALLSGADNDRRLAEHFSGKIHIGFAEIRKHLVALKEYIKRDIGHNNGGKPKPW